MFSSKLDTNDESSELEEKSEEFQSMHTNANIKKKYEEG